jgi:hypothetical protein
MAASLIRSRAMVTHAMDRHRWNEIADGAVLPGNNKRPRSGCRAAIRTAKSARASGGQCGGREGRCRQIPSRVAKT